jgi:hypothetical protein
MSSKAHFKGETPLVSASYTGRCGTGAVTLMLALVVGLTGVVAIGEEVK